METKRTKLWRREQGFRVFKARMIYHAACQPIFTDKEGCPKAPLHWHELAKEHWAQVYRTTGTPCSCWMCRGNEYDRKEFKKETKDILNDYS